MWTKLIYDLQQARTEEELHDVINGNASMGQLGYKQLLESTIGHVWMLKEYYDMGIDVDEAEYDRIETDLEFVQKASRIINGKGFEHLIPKGSTHLLVKSVVELSFTTGMFSGIDEQLRRTTVIPVLNKDTQLYETYTINITHK